MNPSQALVLRFSSDLEPVKRGLQQFAGQAVPLLAGVSAAAIATSKNMASMGGGIGSTLGYLRAAVSLYSEFKLALLAAGLAASGMGALFDAAAQQVERLRAIASGSKAAGVSGVFFQAWTQQLEQVGIAAKDAEQALVHAREAVKPRADATGAMAQNDILDMLGEQALGRNHVAAAAYAQFKDSQDVETRIRAVIKAIRDLNVASKELGNGDLNLLGDKLATDVFGSDKFAQPIRDAKTEMAAFEAAGVKAGTILGNDLVAQAKELDDRLRQSGETLSNELAPLYRDLAQLGLDIKAGWVDTVEVVNVLVGALGRAYARIKDIAGAIPSAFAALPPLLSPMARDGLRSYSDYANRGLSNPGAAGALVGAQLGAAADAKPPPDIPSNSPAYVSRTPTPRPPPSEFARHDVTPSAGKSAGDSQTDEVERYIQSLQKSVASLKAEVDTYGKGNVEKAKALDLARAEEAAKQRGTALTDAERQQIEKLATATGELQNKQRQLERASEQAHEQAQFFGQTLLSGLEQAIQKGSSLQDVLKGVVSALEKAALQALVLGQGPLAGLFGTAAPAGATGANSVGGLFGMLGGLFPAHAGGGRAGVDGVPTFAPFSAFANAPRFASGGGFGAILHEGEVILNAAQQRNVANAMGGGVTVHNYGGQPIETRRMSDGHLIMTVGRMIADANRAQDRGLVQTLAERQARRPTG